jgi:NAD(P)-dependent dehydrogenase (short-subunit alcohol dehydrogenase family)
MTNGKLNGKVAVVTGASKGIGAGIAKQFAAEGAAVVVNYASSKSDADKVVDEITKMGGKAVAVQGNVAKKAEVERLFAAAEKAFGKIDILVNNAGVYEFVPLEEVSRHSRSAQAFQFRRREHHQHRFARQLPDSADCGGLQRHERRSGCYHTDTSEGTWPKENPRELH